MKKIKLLFDKRAHPFGSKEHFWHFKLGYLLPSIYYYFKVLKQPTKAPSNNFILIYDDCGPLMNPHIEEMADLLKIPYKIVAKKESLKFDDEVFLPRWDIRLYISFYFLSKNKCYNSDIPIKMKDVKWFINKTFSFRQKGLDFHLKRDLLYTRDLILQRIGATENTFDATYLFLDRSDLHSYYGSKGNAEIKGYGKSRRGLKNIKEKCEELQNENINCKSFQPGAHPLLNQIKMFQNAKGIVALRGAELANLIWLKPKSKVVVIGFRDPAFHLYNYASLLNLKLIERTSNSDFPDIKEYPIKTLLNQ